MSELAEAYIRPIRECIDLMERYIDERPWLHGSYPHVVDQARARLVQLAANGVALHNQEDPEVIAALTDKLRTAEEKILRLQQASAVFNRAAQEAADVAKGAMAQRDVAVLELAKAQKGWAKAATRLGKVRQLLQATRKSEADLKLVLNDVADRLAWLGLTIKETIREEVGGNPAGRGADAGSNGK